MNHQSTHIVDKNTLTMTVKTVSPSVATSLQVLPETHVKRHSERMITKNDGISNTQVVITSLLAGAMAGAIAKSTIAPLDRTKINFQISQTPYSIRAAWCFLCRTYNNEGLRALWRGNSATLARIIPYAAIQFTAHEQWKIVLKVDQTKDDSVNIRRFLAGSLAGITSQSLTYPLDLARARMAVTHKDDYGTLRQVFSKICRDEGMHILYRGYWATILGVIPYAGVSFFTYDTLKYHYREYTNKEPSGIFSLLFGATAGVLGQSSSYPLDIVRRRMQTARINTNERNDYNTILGTLKKIYREEGLKNGFYKGLSMNWVKGPVAVGISFATYDKIRDTLRKIVAIKKEESY